MQILKKVAVALSIAAVAGVVLGALSRILMRLATLVGGGEPGFSWSGTLFIVLIYVVAAVPVAVLAAFTTRWWRWVGGAVGTGLLAVPGLSIAAEELEGRAGWTAVQWAGAIAVTVAIIATTVALPLSTVRLVDRTVTRARLRQPRRSAMITAEPAGSVAA